MGDAAVAATGLLGVRAAGAALGMAIKAASKGKVLTRVSSLMSKPALRIGGGRISLGQAPQHYRKLGPIGKLANPISGHFEKSKAIVTLNWFRKANGRYRQICLRGRC